MSDNRTHNDGPEHSCSGPVRAAYTHIPFCRAKCFYCDFNSYPHMEDRFDAYVDALVSEIYSTKLSGFRLDSAYFGGGTPTVLSPGLLSKVLDALRTHFGFSDDIEATIEANPGTINSQSVAELRSAGFNRLSIGIQSFNDSILARIGRIHTAEQAKDAFYMGRSGGFDNISIDLMYALPGQSVLEWQRTLDSALTLSPEHISLYELTVEEGTIFGNLRKKCMLQLPDEDQQIEMYAVAIETLASAGYERYEISNFAIPGRRSRHNMTYWRNEPYYGFGAGASGYVEGVRYTNLKDPVRYIDAVLSARSAVETSEALAGRQAMGETIMLGLRMIDGMDMDAFKARFGVGFEESYPEEFARLSARGLIEIDGRFLRLTAAGLLVANEVMAELL
ncbi:MAG: radical SAM family heme chaperone HemW [Armatimonadota bacterium]